MGLDQLVREPTRGDYLLDLVFSDIVDLNTKVGPQIADHKVVEEMLKLDIPTAVVHERVLWQFAKADWDCMRDMLESAD